jgi:ATP-dependent Zn protease
MTSATADMHRVAECVETVGINQQPVEELIVEAAKAASIIIMRNFAAVMKIADVLERKRRIEGDEIRQIVREQKENFFQTL